MSQDPATALRFEPEALLAHEPFLRALARSLVHDEDQARDVVQQAWVEALVRPPGLATLRAWLAVAVRHLALRAGRSDRRRQAREQRASRPELVPSTADLVAQEHARRDLMAAVLALPEPARDVIVLRYLEGLPLREVSRRLGLPGETLRTRTRRALALLRARLSRQCGGDRWSLLLLPLCGPSPAAAPPAAAVTASLTWMLLMSTKANLVSAAAALLLAAGAWFAFAPSDRDGVSHPDEVAGADPVPAALRAPPSSAPAEQEPGSAPARQEVAAPASRDAALPATAGSLRIRVTWGDDHQPAAQVGVLVHEFRPEGAGRVNHELLSDERGEALLADLVPGRVFIVLDRGGQAQARVEPGQETVAEVSVPPGGEVRGVVVDRDRRPVGGAEVLMTWGPYLETLHLLCRTAADGSFTARSVTSTHLFGARAPGHAPSRLKPVRGEPGGRSELELVLGGPGAELRGVVLDPEARPVPRAQVLVGRESDGSFQYEPGTREVAPFGALVTTDAHGRFVARGLLPGAQPLQVVAPVLAPWAGTVELQPGVSSDIEVRLLPGVVLSGTAVDAAGVPAERAEIRVGPHNRMAGRSAFVRKDGSFVLRGLSPGQFTACAELERLGKLEQSFQAVAGETVRWDLVLSAGLVLRGRVVDRDGKPVASAMVEASGPWSGVTVTDREGRFEFKNTQDAAARIRVSSPGASSTTIAQLEARPGPAELLIRVTQDLEATVMVRGRCVDGEGKPLAGVRGVLFASDGAGTGRSEASKPGSGELVLGPVTPGRYLVRLEAPEGTLVVVPARRLARGETWDLGEIRFPAGGRIALTLRRGDGSLETQGFARIATDSGLTLDRIDVRTGSGTSLPVPPGNYVVEVGGKSIAAVRRPCVVRAGATASVDVVVEAGVPCTVRCRTETEIDAVSVAVHDADGVLVFRGSAWQSGGVWQTLLALRPGRYRVTASADPGLRGETAFELAETSRDAAVDVALR